MSNYLDTTGLSYFWQKIKGLLSGKLGTRETAYKTASVPMGQVDSTSTATVFTATVDGITELRDGVCMWLKNGVVTSASGFTININNLGAKPVYSNLAETSRSTTIFNVNYTMLFVYNSTRVAGGCWDIVYGYDTTYSAGTGLSLFGTTFSNSGVTGIKGNNESNYRTGQIILTPHDIGASYGVNEVLNPFAPETSYKVRIDRLENAFYFADKRWTVTATATDSNNVETSLTSSQIANLFDMKEGDLKNVPANGSLVITIDFGENLFPNYPYGEVYLNFYYNRPPKTVSARVYGKHTGTEFYWANLSCNIDSRSNDRTCRYIVNQQSMYNMRKIEFTITADSETASLSDIAYYLTRADKNKDMPYVSKLRPETLYYNLTAPKFIGDVVETGNTAQSYLQTERLRGEGEASTYYHAIDFGRNNHNQVDFYEYGGVFNFHKHTGATIGIGDTLLGTINDKGWVGKVNNHTINADVPADAMFTDTTYSEATATASGLMSATDKAHLDAVYDDYSSAFTALGVS